MSSLVKKGEKILKVTTQQYEIGLYVAVYDGETCIDQFGIDIPEAKFHKNLKKKVSEKVKCV